MRVPAANLPGIPPSLRSAGRLAALLAAALALLATSVPPCIGTDRGRFEVATTCGPPGVVTLSFDGAAYYGACSGNDCWGFVEVQGGGAVGLPERGEIHPAPDTHQDPILDATSLTGRAFTRFPFALLGEAPVAGGGAAVRRRCLGTPSAASGVVDIACEGDAPGAACAGTLTLREDAP